MTASKECARCGGTKLIPARLEQSMTFYANDDTHHSLCRVGMQAILCQDCGYAEFWVMDPSRALAPDEGDCATEIQEEDF
jgi:predicted nucleic-acid-binding Zn-ribbon protein